MTTPYANTGFATNQITLAANTATKVGTQAAGAPLANRLFWRGMCLDPSSQIYIGPAGVTVGSGFPLQTGIPEERPYGPGIDIYAICATGCTIYVEECAG